MSDTAIADLKDELKGFIEQKTKHLEGIITEKSNIILSMQTRVDSLEKQLLASVNSNVQLTSRVATLEAKLQKLEVKIDDNEQRGRKMNLRIEGIAFEEGETKGQLKTKILNTLNKMDANINAADICRFHRSGKPRVDRPRGPDGKLLPLPVDPETPVVKVAQTIVKFRHWDARDSAYQAKFVSKAKNFREQIVVDLTKRRKALLDQARGFLGKDHPFAHAFADQECQVAVKIRASNQKLIVNTLEELQDALAQVPTVPMPMIRVPPVDDLAVAGPSSEP